MVRAALIAALVLAQADGDGLSYGEILHSMGERPRDATARLIEGWLAAHPGDPGAGQAWLQAGELWVEADALAQARACFQRAERLGGATGDRARARLGDVALMARDFDEALRLYGALTHAPEAWLADYGRASVQEVLAARARRHRAGALSGLLAAEVLGLAGYAWWRARGAAFWPLPWEVKLFGPTAGLLCLAAVSLAPFKRNAIWTVCLGGLALVTANAAFVRAAAPRPWRRALWSVVAVASAAALVYVAMATFQLLHLLGGGGPGDQER